MVKFFLQKQKNIYITPEYSIGLYYNDNFHNFIQLLANDEEKTIMEHYSGKKRKTYCQSTDPFDIEMHKIENLQFKTDEFDDLIEQLKILLSNIIPFSYLFYIYYR